jgi:hypothetical protein
VENRDFLLVQNAITLHRNLHQNSGSKIIILYFFGKNEEICKNIQTKLLFKTKLLIFQLLPPEETSNQTQAITFELFVHWPWEAKV